MKIAFIGASGYGNVGDDTYPIVLRREFPEHTLIFYNSNLPSSLPDDVNLVVLGGGGLIHNANASPRGSASHHFRCMRFYMEWATRRGIPWGILSCGVQLHGLHRRDREEWLGETLTPWVPWLRKAHFITMRSPACAQAVEMMSERSDVLVFPDLAYLFRPASVAPTPRQEMVTFVMAGCVNPREIYCKRLLRAFKAANLRIVWLSMGANVDDKDSIAAASQSYPEAVVIPRSTPEQAYQQIAASCFVVSGRYHGMVFSRTSGVPCFIPDDSPWKIRQENFAADMSDASGHTRTLRSFLATL